MALASSKSKNQFLTYLVNDEFCDEVAAFSIMKLRFCGVCDVAHFMTAVLVLNVQTNH